MKPTHPHLRRSIPVAMPCLYCGVDSGPVLTFFIILIGAGLLGFVCVLIWGWSKGKFSDEHSSSMIPLEIEKEKGTLT